MRVWKSDEKLLISASLTSPGKIILFKKKYQAFDTLFHHQMKYLEVRQKYSAARRSLYRHVRDSQHFGFLFFYVNQRSPLF